MKFAFNIGAILFFIFGLLVWGWVLVGAVTWQMALMSLAGICLASLPLSFSLGWWQKRPYFKTVTALQIIAIIMAGRIILGTAPTGKAAETSPISHQFVGYEVNERPFPRFSLPIIVPEKEQINFGYRLMPLVDPFLTREQARRVSIFTWQLYDEMEADPHFRELGSVLGWAYAELGQRPFNVNHYYLYVPQSQQNTTEPNPAIVFLHGSGGNFKPYSWIWSKFAEAEGFVIIAPSYGFGNWDEEGITAVQAALQDAMSKTAIDPNQLYLAGLSNGGLGASKVASRFPELFQGVIFLSPVMDTAVVDSDPYHQAWNGRPHLVITGEQDKRIPIGYVNGRVSSLQNGGVNVTYHTYPTEDHFLFFSQPETVIKKITAWQNN